MKRIVVIALAAFTVAGCLTSPYDQVENWLIREDAVRAFAIPADVIYVQKKYKYYQVFHHIKNYMKQ